jgi:hypothetical protein
VLHHLPTGCARRGPGTFAAPVLLIFLYYARQAGHWRVPVLVTGCASPVDRRDPAARSWITWLLALSVYLHHIGLGHLLRPLGLSRFVPLHEFYRGKSLLRIRQDVYDRFFTRIEQRFTKRQILSLADTFREVVVSDRPPYWHFLCCREWVATPSTYRIS